MSHVRLLHRELPHSHAERPVPDDQLPALPNFHNTDVVKNYFGRFKIPLGPNSFAAPRVTTECVDFQTGKVVEGYTPPNGSRSPPIQIPGTVPNLGSRLVIFWPYAIPLLVAIAGAHFTLSFSVIWFTRHVIVKDDSSLAVARLLRPLVGRLGDSGTLLDGNATSDAVHRAGGLVYGPRPSRPSGDYYLDIASDIPPRLKNERHPDRRYR